MGMHTLTHCSVVQRWSAVTSTKQDISVIKANEPRSYAKKANDHNNDHNYSTLHHNTVYYLSTKQQRAGY